MSYAFEPIGVIHSCFKEKFGIPRQPGLVPSARAVIELTPPFDRDEAVRGLEGFSHVWVVFVFHAVLGAAWRPTVRPPRLGGNERVGVFATRSPFRPNPVGMSAVRLEKILREDGRLSLYVQGGDFLDGTPVIDVKPYVPYVDAIADARGSFAHEAPVSPFLVRFSADADVACQQKEGSFPGVRRLIEEMLSADPRPAYRDTTDSTAVYGTRLYDFDLRWRIEGNMVEVLELVSP